MRTIALWSTFVSCFTYTTQHTHLSNFLIHTGIHTSARLLLDITLNTLEYVTPDFENKCLTYTFNDNAVLQTVNVAYYSYLDTIGTNLLLQSMGPVILASLISNYETESSIRLLPFNQTIENILKSTVYGMPYTIAHHATQKAIREYAPIHTLIPLYFMSIASRTSSIVLCYIINQFTQGRLKQCIIDESYKPALKKAICKDAAYSTGDAIVRWAVPHYLGHHK